MADNCLCAADLDVRLEFQRLQATPDAAGHIDETQNESWQTVGKRWAQVLTKGSREFFRREQVAAEITHQITIRYDKTAVGWTTKMRALLNGRQLNIAGPIRNIDEKSEWLVFPAIEVQ